MKNFAIGFILAIGLLLSLPASAQFNSSPYLSFNGYDQTLRVVPANGFGFFTLPPCPTDPSLVPFGGMCRDNATGCLKGRSASGFGDIKC